jgi:hypothetical protein
MNQFYVMSNSTDIIVVNHDLVEYHTNLGFKVESKHLSHASAVRSAKELESR